MGGFRVLLFEKIFLGFGILIVILTIAFILMMEYRKYLKAKLYMEKSKQDIEEKMDAYNAKFKGEDVELDRFRQEYHEYIVDKRLDEDTVKDQKLSSQILNDFAKADGQDGTVSLETPAESQTVSPDDLASHSNYN